MCYINLRFTYLVTYFDSPHCARTCKLFKADVTVTHAILSCDFVAQVYQFFPFYDPSSET